MQDTLDRQIVQQALFNPNIGKFRGGGDEVGAALANFINAREDARARANRNEMLRQMDREEATRLQNANGGYNVEGASGQTNWDSIFNPSNQTSAEAAYAEQAPTNVMYSGRTGNGNIDYSFPARRGKEPNDYTFQNVMPTEQNGFHLGSYPQTEMYGDPKDFQRQMVRNAAGLNGDSKWFNPSVNGDNTMNIKDQGIGQNYNKRINSQIDGFYPQSPNSNVNSFGKVFQNAENTPKSNTQTIYGDQARQFNQYRQDLLKNQLQNNANPSSPAVDSPSAQATGGNNINSVGTTKAYYGKDPNVSDYDARVRDLANAKYLDKQYSDYDQWSRFVNDNGVTNGSLRHVLYEDRVQPLIEQARQERLRESYRIANDPNVDSDTRTQALAALAYDLKKPDLVNDVAWAEERRQMEREGNALRNQNILSQINHRNFQDLGDYAGANLEGKSWVRNNDGVDLSNAKPHTIAGLNHISDIFQQMTGKQLIVTSGNDGDMHAGGEFSHGKGWKVDVSGNGLEDPNIRHQFIQQCENLGIKVLDEYENPSANSTGGHLDLQFSGYRGNVTGRRGRSPYGSTIDKQALKAQQNFEKNTVGMRKSAMALAGLQNIDPNDEKSVGKYEKGMDDFAKQIEGLYDSYGLSGNKMDSTRLGIALYHELNETRSGLRPETLAEGVARAIYAKRGDVSPEELQRSILAEVYGNNGGGEQGNQQTTTNTPTDKTLQESDNRRMDRLVNGDLEDDNSEGVLVTSDGRRFTDSQLNARDMFLKERHVNPQYKSGSTWWNGMFSI